MKSFVATIALVLLCGCTSMQSKASRYAGDGKLRVCSTLFGQGYDITFPSFPADQSYSASYKLTGVPSVDNEPHAYLSFLAPSESDAARPLVTAVVHVTLEDATGNEVHSFELPLAKAIWRWSQGVFGAYDEDKSIFHFDPSASYVLRVSYTPGSTPPPAKEVYFEIDACAFY